MGRDLSQVLDKTTVFLVALTSLGMSKNGRRMDGHEDRFGKRGRPWSAPHLIESNGLAEDRLGCRRAEADDDAGVNDANFSFEPGPARGDLSGRRFFVFAAFALRFPFKVFHGIGDKEVPSIDSRFAQGLV
jgi:hypothetical protein